eukprot:s1891_g9.t1
MLRGWQASESSRLQKCGRYLLFACFLTLATFAVASFSAFRWADPHFVSLSAALQAGIYGEAVGDSNESESSEEEEEAEAEEGPEEAEAEAPVQTPNASNAIPAAAEKAKLIFVNCVEDGKPVKKRGLQGKVLMCQHQCNLTVNKRDFARADAVVFNPLWMTPLRIPPRTKLPGQIWAYSFHFESASQHTFARKATQALSGKVDLTMTYKGKSDIFRPYYRFRSLKPEERPDPKKDYAQGKQHLLLWFVSNCGAKGRMSLFKGLQKILGPEKVHMFGACGRSAGCSSAHSGDPCNVRLMSKYKFYAAFENTRCEGYITEKFFRGLGSRTPMVPLALGGLGRKDYEFLAPPDSFLHVDDFSSLEELAQTLLEIDADDTRYNRFHAWRQMQKVTTQTANYRVAYCDLCERLHSGQQLHPRSYGGSLEKWMFDGCLSDGPRWKA